VFALHVDQNYSGFGLSQSISFLFGKRCFIAIVLPEILGKQLSFRLRASGGCITNSSMSNTITVRLPADLIEWLEEEARTTGLPKGRIVREQLEISRTRKACQPFMDLAGSVDGPPDLSSRKGFGR
jgi:hypothetical protein